MRDRDFALLHPDGIVSKTRVHSPCDGVFGGRDVDLLLFRDDSGCGRAAYAAALRSCVTALADDGLIVVFTSRRRARRRLLRELKHARAHIEGRYGLVVGASGSRHAVRLEPRTVSVALRHQPRGRTWRGPASRVFFFPGAMRLLYNVLPDIAVVARRRPVRPLAEWLENSIGGQIDAVSLYAGRPHSDSRVAIAFERDVTAPRAIAKVGSRAKIEHDRLASLAPAAVQAGVHVPRVLAVQTLGDRTALIEEFIRGSSAAHVLAKQPDQLTPLLERLTRWIGAWNRATTTPMLLGADDLERLLIAPAKLLSTELPKRYVASLFALAREWRGQLVPFVAAHNDLTMWNLIISNDSRLSVLDWEDSRTGCLPLGDFYYAAADAAAATDCYADRARAAEACFTPSGRHADLVSRLRASLVAAARLPPGLTQLSFHACWLHHARNEADKAEGTQFLRILQRVAV